MQVYINMIGEKTFPLEVEPEETIVSIKAKITDKVGYPITTQPLIYNKNQLLDDDRTLADYDIPTEAVLYVK